MVNKRQLERRAKELIDLAVQEAKNGDLELAQKYVKLARDYAKYGRFRLTIEYRRKFCRKCNTPFIPGKTLRVRIKSKILIRSCLVCGWIRRYELKAK
ncbi:RNAse P, Rpr2/Rpp21 subunit [Acidianus sulfidivorans JP7]|uniref:Ribonuclease P protein component 4 n=1 Tax=Acidianus sulfidivorans JP7 TaxID=619593 RepID=A0A2U9IKM6_9CREN|nr:RNAse P, Rpr2/Rpp21 subunit [Acidianus sulfidivorans]AWR96546.1 RNAse P, Rpr2/Rpp21 subunit [Acidianus sulfidivorans JP7]